MREPFRGAAIGLVSLAMMLGVSQPAHACSCLPLTLEGYIAESTYVFRAYVTGAMIETDWRGKSKGRVVVSLKEIIPYKGGTPPFDELHTPEWGPSCGMKIAAAEHYWFFTDATGRVSKCGASGVSSLEMFEEMEMSVIDEIWRYKRADRPE